MRSDGKATEEEEANEEERKKEKANDNVMIKDDDMALYRDDFNDFFASKQPSIGRPIIRELTNQPTRFSYKKSIVKGKRKGSTRLSEGL